MSECPSCGVNLSENQTTTLEAFTCFSCGNRLRVKDGIVRTYLRDVWTILSRPTAFFQTMPTHGGIKGPLVFALVTHWIGSAADFLWKASLGNGVWFEKLLELARLSEDSEIDHPGQVAHLIQFKERFSEWISGAGPVIVDPFFTLAWIMGTSFLLMIGARIFVSSREVSYESSVRITSFALTPAILACVPFAGKYVGTVYGFIITVIGVREVYRTTNGLAFIVALFRIIVVPTVIALGVLMSFIFVGAALMKLFF